MAGLPKGERFEQQPLPRPGLYPQHSNSVPSTPYQKPLDFARRYSRSPSPSRALSNQSPHSVISEARGANGTHSGAPRVLCKFETGDEFRKRRMPYLDGGDQELQPPQKDPRKTLQPDEREKLSGDMRELYDRLLPSKESEDRRSKLVEKLERILDKEWPGKEISVNVFGSSGNLLSSTDSDVDICITTPVKELESMHGLAEILHRHGMERVVCRAAAKVPIVKCWDPELRLASDLNINNPLALQNTRLIKTYVELDDRVRPLAKIIKYWTKQRILNDAAFGATISSYTWICMVISFLQRRNPPILPSLQKIKGCRQQTESESSPFADDVDALRRLGNTNTESLGELLFQFFRHYGYEFEYSKHVVSVREGKLVSRKEKGWDQANALVDKQASNRLCVEEPFTTQRNLGNTADEYAWHGIHLEIRRAFELLDNGLQLQKCCEQYEFPKEEKPIFQKPPPKPKPTLTRSASQSGQTNREPGSGGRSRKNNRNQSSQRAGNRRASSGASFSNQRLPFLTSPPGGAGSTDYFQMKGSLHEQLYLQYQYLQARQDALRSQLAQQQAQTQTQSRVGDLASSPRPRPYLNGLATNGLTSPLLGDNPPQTAPLLPGYLYHYPARYPPPSTMSQARSREGTNTNPSSPSLVAAVPALRRQVHRASVAGDGTAGSVRSQSQPGRSLPHPLTLQQHVHPGYDVSGALGSQIHSPRSTSQVYHPGQPGAQLAFSPFTAVHPNVPSLDSAMPKEYVGYYMHSPNLRPQQYPMQQQAIPTPLNLKNPPIRQRRVTPELPVPAMSNGRHNSRSPSPLHHNRSFSSIPDRRASQPVVSQSANFYDEPAPLCRPPLQATPAEMDTGGPLIVNGSNRAAGPKSPERLNGVVGHPLYVQPEGLMPVQPLTDEHVRAHPLSVRTDFDTDVPERVGGMSRRSSSPRLSPTSTAISERRFNPVSPNGVSQHANGYPESTPLSAPLLSPVAELRTPSPTHSRFDSQASPEANGNLIKAAKINHAKQIQREVDQNQPPRSDSRHDRRGSAPVATQNKPNQTPRPVPLQAPTQQNPNTWQPAPTKKGHKKNKSITGTKSPMRSSGQPIPTNEAERKGG